VIRDPPPESILSPRKWEALKFLRAVPRGCTGEGSRSFSLRLSPCSYVVVKIHLRRGGAVRVEWISCRGVYVGVGTRE